MDFKFNEEQKMLRQLARDFAGDEITPLVDAAEKEGRFPKELLPKVGELGFLDPDLDVASHCIICEEMCKVSMGIWDTPVTILMSSTAIARHGSEYLKQKYLPPVRKGEMVICFALTDVSGGSDIGGMESTARRDGNSYILNGHKTFISMAPYSDAALVVANLDRSKRTRGLTMFVVDKDTPGFSVGKHIDKMGMHSSLYGEVILEDCRIPKESLVGEEMGFMQVQESLAIERTILGAEVLGICEAAYEAALNYSKERKAFGKPIGKFQGISFKLVDMAIAIEAVRWLTYWSAWLWDQGEKPLKEASMVKHFAVEVGCQVTDLAMRIFGGYGYCKDLPIERYFRDVRGLLFGDGTQEIQKIVIAKALGL